MNIQSMLQQAQKMQKDMEKIKKEKEEKIYVCEKSFVKVETKGTKELLKISINIDKIDKEDIEMLEDIIIVAVNENNKKIDDDMKTKMGKFGHLAGLM